MFRDNASIHSLVIYLIISSVGAYKLDQTAHKDHRTSAAEINQDKLLPLGHRGQRLGPTSRQTDHEIELLKINRELHNVDLDERDARDNHVQSDELVNDNEVDSQLNKVAHGKDITKVTQQRIDTEETLAKEDNEEGKEQFGEVPHKEQDNSRPGVGPEDTNVRGSEENENEENIESDKAEIIDHSSIETQPTKPPTAITSTTELEEIDEANGDEYVQEEHSPSNNETSWDQIKHTTLAHSTTTTNSGYHFNNGSDITEKQNEVNSTSRHIKTQNFHENLTQNANDTAHSDNGVRNENNNVKNTERSQQIKVITHNATTNIETLDTKVTHKDTTLMRISELPTPSPSIKFETETGDNNTNSLTVIMTKSSNRVTTIITQAHEKLTLKGKTKDVPLPSTKLKEAFVSSSTFSDTTTSTSQPTKHVKDVENSKSTVVRSRSKPNIVHTKVQTSTSTLLKTNSLKFESNKKKVESDVKDGNKADVMTTPYSTDRHTTYYDSSSVLASTLGGAFLGGLLILGMIYCKKRINRYVRVIIGAFQWNMTLSSILDLNLHDNIPFFENPSK